MAKKIHRIILQLDMLVDVSENPSIGELLLSTLKSDIDGGWIDAEVLAKSVVHEYEVPEVDG